MTPNTFEILTREPPRSESRVAHLQPSVSGIIDDDVVLSSLDNDVGDTRQSFLAQAVVVAGGAAGFESEGDGGAMEPKEAGPARVGATQGSHPGEPGIAAVEP